MDLRSVGTSRAGVNQPAPENGDATGPPLVVSMLSPMEKMG